jgi:MFS family permease
MNTAAPAPTSPAPSWLVNRNFALLWTGQGISLLGDMAFDTTLVLWVATVIARGQSWGPLAVSGVFLATFVPTIAAGPFAGVWIDRWDKRRAMLVTDALRAALVAILLLLSGALSLPLVAGGTLPPSVMLGAIYLIVALATICTQFSSPASFAMLGGIVPEGDLTRAASRLELNNSMSFVLGPPLAAVLFTWGVQWALALNALSFVASFLIVLRLRVPQAAETATHQPPTGFLREMTLGLRFFAGNTTLMTITIASMIALIGGSAINTLNVFFVTQNLHAPARLLGGLSAAVGAGSVVGALFIALVIGRVGSARAFWIALIVIGALIVVYARLTSFVPAVVVSFLLGVPNSALNVGVGPLILRSTPPELVGRVMSLFGPLLSLSRMFAAVLVGFLASTVLHGLHAQIVGVTLGPNDTIFTIAGLLAIVGGLYAWWKLREIDAGIAAAKPSP